MITLKAEDIIFSFLNKGLCDIGICTAEGFEEEREAFCAVNDTLKGFVEQDIEKRISAVCLCRERLRLKMGKLPHIQ